MTEAGSRQSLNCPQQNSSLHTEKGSADFKDLCLGTYTRELVEEAKGTNWAVPFDGFGGMWLSTIRSADDRAQINLHFFFQIICPFGGEIEVTPTCLLQFPHVGVHQRHACVTIFPPLKKLLISVPLLSLAGYPTLHEYGGAMLQSEEPAYL
jgi:hypothetical protein